MNERLGPNEAGKKIGSVAVVGAGIGGMQAALDLANAGFHVTLIEQTPAIGGRMAQLDKTFPTNDCSMCTISPKLIEVDKHLNIDLVTCADVVGLEGVPGNYRLRVRKRPRYVDLEKCNACGDCLEVCPVELPGEFDQQLSPRKAIYKRYPQAIPGAMAISKAGRPPCVLACPAHVNCQGYVALAAAGRFAEAYDLVRRRNPFPSACGRICHHPCEGQCNRLEVDEAVAINPIKRFVADWVARKRAEGEDPAPPPRGQIDPDKPKVAVIGGGPAGLTAARDLALLGYPVTLFEAHEKLGGTMLLGVPNYRLPEDALQRDIDDILASGFEVRMGMALGRDFSLEDLRREGYRAVFLGIGCTRPAILARSTDGSPMPGLELEGVLWGLDFLRDVKLGRAPQLFGKVVVIGGGNVAVDVAMTARRQGAQHVEIVCLEQREEMPAYEWEIADAVEEGVELRCGWGPKAFSASNGRVGAVTLQRCTRVFDDQGCFSPQFGEELWETQADWVVVAIGQRSDFSFLPPDSPLWDESKRFIQVDPVTLQTNIQWLFAGGDLATGPRSVIEAVAQGHDAAESIDRFLRGADLVAGRRQPVAEPAPKPPRPFPQQPRAKPPREPAAGRAGYEEIEHTLSEAQVVAEAKRCLACGLCSECLQCVKACTAGAVIHDMLPEEITVEAGAVILSPGFDPFDAAARAEYGYGRYANVVTSLEFERILSASGPFQGHIRRPSDHREPKRIAWIQCVGSRDLEAGNPYCSGVCCMYAIKEAMMAVDHVPGLEAVVYYNDIRAYGKGFEAYYETARGQYGVQFRRGIISTVKERQQTKNLVLTFVDEEGHATEEEFDLVVLSVGLRPSASTQELAAALGVDLDETGFCRTDRLDTCRTSKPGVFVAGTFAAPIDIPETVMTASAAAAAAAELLAEVRGTRTRQKSFPPERDVSGEEPRVGVFVCRCGTNIARVVGVSDLVQYARSLPTVVHAEENLYTCSTDTQQRIVQTIREQNLNRVVVASCTPRTHEPLFQETLREAGLNKHLFEMANIRDQCSWVHYDRPEEATRKARDLVRMAVARAATLRPFADVVVPMDQRALVIGAGPAGMTAALSLAEQGFEVSLVEREAQLGGTALRLRHLLHGTDPQQVLADMIRRVEQSPRIHVYLQAEVDELAGHVGQFRLRVRHKGGLHELGGGAVIVATGAVAAPTDQYGYGKHPRIVTQLELEQQLADGSLGDRLQSVVMIQCVGSREPQRPYCSRVCCQQAVKNALAIKRENPKAEVFVLYRDMRTYGFDELYYQQARDAGVVFLRYPEDRKPEVLWGDRLEVTVVDDVLRRPVRLQPSLLVLSVGVAPHPQAEAVSRALKVPLTADGFFLEAHMKLRPLDFASDGIFLAGTAHGPKTLAEAVSQAKGAAARAATVLCKCELSRSGIVSEVDQARCAACLTCVRLCPYDVPVIDSSGVAYIEPASCQGCGVCAAACPRKAITTRHYRDEQVISKLDVLFDPGELPLLAAGSQPGEKR